MAKVDREDKVDNDESDGNESDGIQEDCGSYVEDDVLDEEDEERVKGEVALLGNLFHLNDDDEGSGNGSCGGRRVFRSVHRAWLNIRAGGERAERMPSRLVGGIHFHDFELQADRALLACSKKLKVLSTSQRAGLASCQYCSYF